MKKIIISQIHIYLINFYEDINYLDRSVDFLSDDEINKVNKMKFESDRNRAFKTFLVRRKILSYYTDISPDRIIIGYNANGKPFVAEEKFVKIKFNYSHSHDFLVFAICLDNEIGVDFEFIKALPDLDNLAVNYFSQEEFCYYQSFKSPEEKLFFFYKIWTRKEALLKAIGTGLTDSLKDLKVFQKSANNNSDLLVNYHKKNWIISDLQVPENFIGSLAYKSEKPKELIYFDSLPKTIISNKLLK